MSRQRTVAESPNKRRRRRRGHRVSSGALLGVVFLTLVAINVYVFFLRGGTSVHDLLQTSAIHASAIDAPVAPKGRAAMRPARASEDDAVVVVRGSMQGQLGLSSALQAAHLSAADASELTELLRPLLDLRALQPSQSFEIRLDPTRGQLQSFVYVVSRTTRIDVSRNAQGTLRAERIETPPERRTSVLSGRVTSSLDRALLALGETSTLTANFSRLFNWDINWYTDPRADDTFRVVVEKEFIDGTFYRYGRILAAEYSGEVGRLRVFYFEDSRGRGDYYTAEGRSVERLLLKTPLNYLRISSHYNLKRKHPVLHVTRGHYGVDFAAPTGTPVWAAAGGTVEAAHFARGAGNMIVLRHPQGIRTSYLHLSRFAAGIKVRATVRQGQVIGFVGATGLATGPHLHYGITIQGRHVDPLKYQPAKGQLLSAEERQRFLRRLPELQRQLAATSLDEGRT